MLGTTAEMRMYVLVSPDTFLMKICIVSSFSEALELRLEVLEERRMVACIAEVVVMVVMTLGWAAASLTSTADNGDKGCARLRLEVRVSCEQASKQREKKIASSNKYDEESMRDSH